MSRHHQKRRRQSPPSTIIYVPDRDSDTNIPPRQTERHEKPCLTWLKLALGALIPLAIGICTVVITVQQQQNEDRRFQQTQDNEYRRREQDQQQADNLHYQNVYNHYIIDISNSIFKQQNQTTTFVDNRSRLDYIRSQTLTTLVDLDCQRKTWLFEFLHENQLLPSSLQSTSMNLQNTNFSCITLKDTISKKFVFNGLVLSSVDLNDASFIKCLFLDCVDFRGSSMAHINLIQSSFYCFNGTTLFERAMLSHANFYRVFLYNVSFDEADLTYANFTSAVFNGKIVLTGADLAFTTFKDVIVEDSFSMIITNANMTGASFLEDKSLIKAMSQGLIDIMNVILPNGTWLLNETMNWIKNGNAETNCTSLDIPNWQELSSSPDRILPTLSVIHLNASVNSSLGSYSFNFTAAATAKPVSLARWISFSGISKFIQSSEAECHLSFDINCQGGVIQVRLYSFTSSPNFPKPSGKIIVANNGQTFYKDSSDCPGNLKWSTTGITVLGNGYGIGPDQLQFPHGLFIEPKTQILYVADVSSNRVQKMYPNGKIETAAGQANGDAGSTSDKLNGPRDIFADENENVFVVDEGNQRVQFWEKNAKSGKTVAGNGTSGSALNEFSYPFGLVLDSKKNILVADMQNQRIIRWSSVYDPRTSTGTIVAGGNGQGMNPYQLNNPIGLYLDEPNNNLYISNEESHSVTQWNMEAYGDKNIYAGIPGRPGNSAAQLNGPQGVILDKYGNLYIADCTNNRIQMFCPNAVFGITIAGTGRVGNGSNELYFPRDVAFDSEMNLYVTDTYNYRIQKFARIQ
ncbi:unnamed protein product [Adineta steineri]|uniref:Uncharacterized protein n=3 Tax=Adineta steineri TaxID=433720 RepID=A0A814PIH5_9BILA|nr:unnamed protein product [Adineta steineri]CAF1104730.1 unnamed protein product [Adineta steineri]